MYSVLLNLQWPSEQWMRCGILPTRPGQSAGSHVHTAQRISAAISVRQKRSYRHSLELCNIRHRSATKLLGNNISCVQACMYACARTFSEQTLGSMVLALTRDLCIGLSKSVPSGAKHSHPP